MNGIIGLPQVLRTEENLSREQLEMLDYIEQSGKNMLNKINLSLDLFRMETGQYEYHPELVDVVGEVSQVIQQLRTRWSSKNLSVLPTLDGITLKGDEQFHIWSSELLLESVLSNLLVNAIDASPKGEAIYVNLQDSRPIVLSITNQGAVPLAVRENFFEKYNTSGKNHGTGLGTYSARLMSEAMNYQISMQTWDQENTTRVELRIPREKHA